MRKGKSPSRGAPSFLGDERTSKMVQLLFDQHLSREEAGICMGHFGQPVDGDSLYRNLLRAGEDGRLRRIAPGPSLLASLLRRFAEHAGGLRQVEVVPPDVSTDVMRTTGTAPHLGTSRAPDNALQCARVAAESVYQCMMQAVVAASPSQPAVGPQRAARWPKGRVKTCPDQPGGDEPYVIGLIGGRTPSLFARALAERLARDECLDHPRQLPPLPRQIVIRSLMGPIAPDLSAQDPNAFVENFAVVRSRFQRTRVRFETFPAPGVMRRTRGAPSGEYPLCDLPILDECFASLSSCQVVVGSCGHWGQSPQGEQHSSLYSYLQQACAVPDPAVRWDVIQAHCAQAIGDVCGILLDSQGDEVPLPADVCLPMAQTLPGLLQFIDGGGKVLLIVARCNGRGCTMSKGAILHALLRRSRLPFTHLVTDFESAEDCCRRLQDKLTHDDIRVPLEGCSLDSGRVDFEVLPKKRQRPQQEAKLQRKREYLAQCEMSLRSQYRLASVGVVPTLRPMDIAVAATQHLLEFLRDYKRTHGEKKVTIGMAGGHTPSLMIQQLADILSDPEIVWNLRGMDFEELPRQIEFRSVVGVIDHATPEVDPNTYIHRLAAVRPVRNYFQIRFVTLPVPGVLTAAQHRRVLASAAMNSLRDCVTPQCDLLVLSCGHWGPGHNSLYDYLSRTCGAHGLLTAAWENTKKEAQRSNVVGDIGWCLIDDRGQQIDCEEGIRISHLMSWKDLNTTARFRPRPVLLLAPPCSGTACNHTKAQLLKSLLVPFSPHEVAVRRTITHLVTDLRSARELLGT